MQVRRGIVAAGTAVAALLLGGTVAYADESDRTASEIGVVQEILNDSAAGQVSSGDVVATTDGATVVIPTDASDPIVVRAEGAIPLEVGLPSASVVEETTVDATTASVAHEMQDGSTVLPLVRADGALQVLSVLNSAGDPTTYEYDFGSDAGASVSLLPDGSALVVDGAGEELATVDAPWAVDNEGSAVATRFVADGNTLTQIVEPTESAAYPIVADPAITVTTYQYKYVDVAKTSNWTNKGKQLGICKVTTGGGGGTCVISTSTSVSTTIQTSFGITASTVAANIGISATKNLTVSVQWTSPKAPVGSSYKAWAVGTKVTYKIQKWKVSKAGGITARSLISTSSTLTSFSPVAGFAVGQ